jgi:hypothetical protein
MDGGARFSGCMAGVGTVVDGATSISGSADKVGTVADGGTTYVQARAFAAADVASGFARLPDCSPPV